MQPSDKYNEFMRQSGFLTDSAQQHTIYLLDYLNKEIKHNRRMNSGLWQKLTDLFRRSKQPLQGMYIWGGVGRGKTFLMDIFFEVLSIRDKKRFHFHHFMQQIHNRIDSAPDGCDPILEIAHDFAQQVKVLCLDEFVVNDIADAMLIGRLLEALFEQGVVLVTTSNSPPEALYKDGLQRDNFLPAIGHLMQHCQVTNLDGGQDYRASRLQQTGLYQTPDNEQTRQSIREYAEKYTVSDRHLTTLEINGREIQVEKCAEDMVWFSFAELCKTPRSRFDYLEIAREFSVVIITGIEAMNDGVDDVARRFVSLIDVLYDHRVKLVCSAAVAMEDLYRQQFLAFEFRRTLSRLREMQSSDYLARAHIA